MSSARRGGLRPEARSVYVDNLSRDQERAFEVLVGLLEAALTDLPDEEEWARDPMLQRDTLGRSTSRVLHLGGGRGSGKTTVAATLRAALTQTGPIYTEKARDRMEGDARGAEQAEDEDPPRELRKLLERRVRDLRPHVIVLEPLSMEEAPSGTNILAAVLARIEQKLFPHLSLEDVPQTASDQRHHSAVLELMRLQTDVAIAWDGNLGDRRGRLDPDNYAMEELRIERVRLQIRDRFETVLRRTARDNLDHQESALFLLVVDDADINPAQLVELVQRLRMVGVPELAVLLIGDYEAMEDAFRLHFANRFRMSAGTAVTPSAIGMAASEMAAATNALARSALRRHIPYGQRVELTPLLARDAVKVKPFDEEEAYEKRSDLATMLQRVRVSYPTPPFSESAATGGHRGGNHSDDAAPSMSLLEFICPAKRGASPSEEQSWYVGSRALSDSPRVAIDLWSAVDAASAPGGRLRAPRDPWDVEMSLQEPGAMTLDPRLREHFRRLAAERLDAKSDWGESTSPVNDALREAIIRDGNLRALALTVTHTCRPDDESVRRARDDEKVFWTFHRGLDFEVAGQRTSRREIGPTVLSEDLWALENRTAAQNSTAIRSRDQGLLRWVVSGADAEDVAESPGANGEAVEQKLESTEKLDAWPIPRYRTLRQIEQFGYVWNTLLGRFAGEPPLVQDLVLAWKVIHTETLLGLEPVEVRADDSSAGLPPVTAKPEPGSSGRPKADAGTATGRLTWQERVNRFDSTLRAELAAYAVQHPGEWTGVVADRWLSDLDELEVRTRSAD